MNGESHAFLTACMDRQQEAFEENTRLWRSTFENDSGAVEQMHYVRAYADNWQNLRYTGGGLLLWGPCGTGKTFAAAALANRLCRQGVIVRMVEVGRLMTVLPCLEGRSKLDYLEQLYSAELLILDDFGCQRRTDYTREQLFSLVNERYLRQLPVVVTTNMSLNAMKRAKEPADQRIYERLLEMCIPICFDGENLRLQRISQRVEQMRQVLRT